MFHFPCSEKKMSASSSISIYTPLPNLYYTSISSKEKMGNSTGMFINFCCCHYKVAYKQHRGLFYFDFLKDMSQIDFFFSIWFNFKYQPPLGNSFSK